MPLTVKSTGLIHSGCGQVKELREQLKITKQDLQTATQEQESSEIKAAEFEEKVRPSGPIRNHSRAARCPCSIERCVGIQSYQMAI